MPIDIIGTQENIAKNLLLVRSNLPVYRIQKNNQNVVIDGINVR